MLLDKMGVRFGLIFAVISPDLNLTNSPIGCYRERFAARKCLADGKTSYTYGADAGKMFVVFSQCIHSVVSV